MYRRNLPHINPDARPVFVTFCTHGRWILPEEARAQVLRHCLHDHGVKLLMHGAVVMPDHVHLVFTPLEDSERNPFGLAEILNGIKGASSHSVNRMLKRKGHVWQSESFDHILRQNEDLEEKVEYICHNPVRKGLVQKEDEYPWLWREWVEGAEGQPGAAALHVAQQSQPGAAALHVAQPPSAGRHSKPDCAQPGAAVLQRISEAAKELNEQRERWLNPPEWIESVARIVDARDDFADVARVSGEEARELIRQSAIMAEAARDPRLKKRTLTNLYNERPTWLRLAHEKLDRAVLAAYARIDPEGEWSEDWAEVWVETGAGQPLPVGEDGSPHALAEMRAEVDQKVLANLLRMNLARAGAK